MFVKTIKLLILVSLKGIVIPMKGRAKWDVRGACALETILIIRVQEIPPKLKCVFIFYGHIYFYRNY